MSDNLQDKLKRAREAMEDPVHKAARAAEEEDLAKKRARARDAMEGYDRRTKRESLEKLAKQREQAELDKINAAKRREEEAADLRAQAEARKKAAAEAEAKAYDDRLHRIKESETVIESLKKNGGATLTPLRTLKSDLERAVKEEHMSLTQISLKEQEKRRLMQTGNLQSKSRSTIVLQLIGILFLVGAGVGIFLFYPEILPKKIAPSSPEVRIPSLVSAEKQSGLNLNNETSASLRNKIVTLRNQREDRDTIVNIYFTQETPAGKSTAGLRSVLNALEITLPDPLLISLEEDFMLAAYHGEGNGLFLVLKSRSFESTAYNMTKEENSLAADLYYLFTGNALLPSVQKAPFKDVVLRNHDIRVLKNEAGQTALLYGFPDRNTLIIAENEETFVKVINTLENPIAPIQ